MSERDEFEAWHNRFYGPQDKYNPIRSLAHDSCGVGLGYDDPTVQAQFVAFCGALAARAPQAVPALTDEQIRDALHEAGFCVGGGPVPDIWIDTDGLYDGLNRVRKLVSILAAPQPSPERRYQD